MDTLETLSRRLNATSDLQGLVRSLKRLSAVAVSQLDRAEASLRTFRRTIDLGLQVVLRQHPVRPSSLTRQHGMHVIIVFGSDRGLCGAFNEIVAELTRRHLARTKLEQSRHHIVCVGRLAADRLEAAGIRAGDVLETSSSVKGLGEACERILVRLDLLQGSREITNLATIFNERDEDGDIRPRAHVLLPLAVDVVRELEAAPWPGPTLPGYSASHERLFAWLVRQRLLADLYHAALKSVAAENATRLATMQNAERNITDMLDGLTAEYRRMRQEAITSDLMDIVGGYEVLRTSTIPAAGRVRSSGVKKDK